MGKLVIDMFVTLDGVVQGPGGPDEDPEGGFAHGGWQAPYVNEDSAEMEEDIFSFDALLLGRKTYEIFAAYWPNQPDDIEIARKINGVPKFVASRTLTSLDWETATLLGSDVRSEVAGLKDRFNEIHTFGSADLLQTLLKERLVDRMNLWLYPVVLGSGKKLFEEGIAPAAMRLVESHTFPSGALLLVYENAGEPTYGTIGDEDPQA